VPHSLKAACAVFFIIVIAGCSSGPKAGDVQASSRKPDALPVNVARAEARKLENSILVTGSLVADESVTISPEVSGRIIAIRADFGQSVRRGDILAELDHTEYAIQLERTKAALNQSLARLGLKPGQENTPPSSTASMRQSQAQLDDARFKFESAAKLVKTGDISQERFNEIEKAYRARQAGLDVVGDDMRTLWMSVQSLRAEVKLAEKRLRDTTLTAPFDGAVSQKHVSVGQYVKDNTAILTLVKTWPLRLRVDVPESATASVRPGTALVFVTDAAPGSEFQATVRQLNPSLDSKNRSLVAEGRLTRNDARLRPGMFVQVRLITDSAGEVVMVPRRAVYSIAGLTKVFVIKDNKAHEKKLAPGRELNGWMEVPAGEIKAGDIVAINNVATLSDGMEVRVNR